MTPRTGAVLMAFIMNFTNKNGLGTQNRLAAQGCKQYFDSDRRNIIFGKLFSAIRMT
jgi:hypothetical protein